MYKVVLTDDDEFFRKNLIQKTDWNSLNLSVAGEAGNGREALALIWSVRPEIVICDIKMPVMDGITVLKNVDRMLGMKFIILSGFNDFEFTREAIKHGAFDYILKPVQSEEMAGVLIRACDSLSREKNQQNKHLMTSIAIRKKMVDRYESLLIHYTESRDIRSICNCIDDFYEGFDENVHPDAYQSSYTEFVVLASKICEIIRLDADFILIQTEDNPQRSGADRKQAVREKVKQLFRELIDRLICSKNTEGRKVISDALDYIDRNYHQKLSLEMMSKRYFINPAYFCQLFKSVTNENFSAYLTRKRIEKSQELLALKSLKIHQVAEMVGYADEKYFSQVFKRYTGLSPSEYGGK